MTRRCATCGEEVRPGASRCPTCGAEAVPPRAPSPPIRRCPRCGYRGEGIRYFRRPGHVALLAAVALFTYGIGGLVYWLARRNHRICPSCGLGWEHARHGFGAPAEEDDEVRSGAPSGDLDLPPGGRARRVLGVVGILAAVLVISIGLFEGEWLAVATGGVVGLGGAATFWWGWRALQDRREALMWSMQRRILRLAARKGGTLTVTEIAAELDLSMEAAERILISMDDGFRVRSEITREGLLVWEFPEIQHRARLEGGGRTPDAGS